jgi:hypothetical protein
LEMLGIATTDIPQQVHPHPACKTIETYILREAVPPLLAPEDFTVFWCKQRKAQTLADDTKRALTLCNTIIDPKDILRYPHHLERLPPVTTTRLFIHDAAHYLSPLDIYRLFTNSDTLQDIIATVIIPPELLDGQQPLLRELYTFTVDAGAQTFSFYPMVTSLVGILNRSPVYGGLRKIKLSVPTVT